MDNLVNALMGKQTTVLPQNVVREHRPQRRAKI